jgi:hypothetical protein
MEREKLVSDEEIEFIKKRRQLEEEGASVIIVTGLLQVMREKGISPHQVVDKMVSGQSEESSQRQVYQPSLEFIERHADRFNYAAESEG